jgi:YjbE family integral membrane protein
MEFDSTFQIFGISLQVFLIDILLSGDNAVVIALACRTLPANLRRKAMFYGAGAGIAMRLLLTLIVNLVLKLPLLKIIGAIALLLIAIDLMTQEEEISENLEGNAGNSLSSAVMTIITADLVMSLDNVVALAAVSQGNAGYLILGLVLSVPLLIFGSSLLSSMMDEMPELITLGGALLGWVAGSISVTDPLIADWVNTQSPALTLVVPLATALLAVMQSRRLVAERRLLGPSARQSLKLPSLPIWPTRREAEAAPPAPIAPALETVAAAVSAPARVETTQESEPVPAPGQQDADEIENEYRMLSGGWRQPSTDQAPSSDAVPAAIAKTGKSPLSDMKIVFGLVIFVTLLVMLMSAVTDKDQPDAPWTPNFAVAPKPQSLKRFRCDLYDSEFLFNHGAMQVKLLAGHNTLSGVLNRDVIAWQPLPPNAQPLGFKPPTRVFEVDGKSITLDGGGFQNTVCRLELPNTAGH